MVDEQQINQVAERMQIRHQVNSQQTEVVLVFTDEVCRRMDRQQFRSLVSKQLNRVGDELMARWDQLHKGGG